VREVRTMDEPCEKDELLVCGHRLFRAVAVIQAASVAHYLQRMRGTAREREARLRGFNRALTHELKNQIGAILGAADLLELEGLPRPSARRSSASCGGTRPRCAARSTTWSSSRASTPTRASSAGSCCRRRWPRRPASCATRRRGAGVDVRVGDLPAVEVPAAAVELAVTNYLSNAIKYADPDAPAAGWRCAAT
jgi:signal transduction histidine kinase